MLRYWQPTRIPPAQPVASRSRSRWLAEMGAAPTRGGCPRTASLNTPGDQAAGDSVPTVAQARTSAALGVEALACR